ncbi:MAG: histidine kinase [Saprospiraceae bacterium]|nr:histidine kinase [Saprospiraceae bacterium]
MELIPLIAVAIYGISALRKSLDTAKQLPIWDKVLSKVWMGSIVFFALSLIPALEFIGDWYSKLIYLIFFITVYLLRDYRPELFDTAKSTSSDKVYLMRDYRPARLLSLAIVPIGIVYLITHAFTWLTPAFAQENHAYFDTASGFAILWLIGFGIYAIVRIKKERKLRLKMQEETEIAEARKAELEHLVTERTNQLTQQKEELEMALTELKATQAQLIQSEKLASLGELTAGIAHEIQNPLNFVTNFSELSLELVQELKEEIEKPDLDKDLVHDLMNDLSQNQAKINHHGKRAASIVTGMLQHARTSSGKKEPTDLNALADEYLRLSYHGLRAKEKDFNATMKTDFDETIGNVLVIPQDIGRVMLNLITNAFYEVAEKKKQTLASGQDYEPTVAVRTKRMGDKLLFSVKDNGNGIPSSVLEKIFQPFFTTKPTGRGTGLGLSLAYDIVTKGHNGELKVETKEGEGTEFIVILPV